MDLAAALRDPTISLAADAPEECPKIVSNWWGLQVFVYNGTRDFMRRVSAHVSIGKPWVRSLELPFCFSLTRCD